jgi:glycosyltransferase involved in cell wall biosynthesis
VARKTNVLVVIRHPVGGIRTYLKYTYRYLDKSKFQFTLLTIQDPEGSLLKRDLSGFELQIVEIRGRLLFLRLVWSTFLTLQRGKFDLIHSQGFTAGLISVLGNVVSRVPHILTSHDVFRKDQFASWTGGFKKRLLGMLLSQADVIQSVSFDAQENLIHFLPVLGRDKNKLVVIHNGVLVDQEPRENTVAMPTSFRKELGIRDDSLLFGFLGRFMPQKGFDLLIEAVEHLSKEPAFRKRFCVAAVNDGAYVREYRKIIVDKGLTKYFRFCGFTPNVVRVLESLDALVVPSLWEACPLLPMEALVVGCPVIASDCVGLREVVRDTPAVAIRKCSSGEIAAALREFMCDPAVVKKRTLEYVPQARERFSAERTASKLSSLFERTLAWERRPPV